MNQRDDHHIEIGSRWRGNHVTFVAVAVPVTAITMIGTIALLPYLHIIAMLLLACLGLGAALLFGYTCRCIFAWILDLYTQWLNARIVAASEYGVIDRARWKHLPALPPPTITVQEEKPDRSDPLVDRVNESLNILSLHRDGIGYERIAEVYKKAGNKYWTVWRVRKLCEQSENP